jgi:hypothetical protein
LGRRRVAMRTPFLLGWLLLSIRVGDPYST